MLHRHQLAKSKDASINQQVDEILLLEAVEK